MVTVSSREGHRVIIGHVAFTFLDRGGPTWVAATGRAPTHVEHLSSRVASVPLWPVKEAPPTARAGRPTWVATAHLYYARVVWNETLLWPPIIIIVRSFNIAIFVCHCHRIRIRQCFRRSIFLMGRPLNSSTFIHRQKRENIRELGLRTKKRRITGSCYEQNAIYLFSYLFRARKIRYD